MISWVIIIILVVIGIIAIRLNHFRHRIFIILLVVLALFLYTTMTYVNNQNKLDFGDTKGVMNSLKIYTGWLANGFTNLKALTGKATKMDWTSTNVSFFDNKTTKNSSSAVKNTTKK